MSTKSAKKEKVKPDGHLTRTKAVLLSTRTLRRKEGSLKKISEMTQMLLTPIGELTPKVKTKRSPKEKTAEKRDLDTAKRVKQPVLGLGQGLGQGQGEEQGQEQQKRKRSRKRKADTVPESPDKPQSPKKSAPPQPAKTLLPRTPPELTVAELIQIADEHSLDDEDFMEILTCDSPVWWEDPPNETYSEEPIFPKSLYADHYEDVMRCNNTVTASASPSPASISVPHTKHIDYKFMKKRFKLEHLLGNIKNKKNNNNEYNEKEHKNNNNTKMNKQENKDNNKRTQNKNKVDSESTKSLIEVKSPEICNEESINTFTECKQKRARGETNDEINIKDGTAEPEAKRYKKCSESTEDDSIVGLNNEDLLRDLENMDIPIESENENEDIAKTVDNSEINSDDVSCTSQDNMEIETVNNNANNVSESSTHCDTSETNEKTVIKGKKLEASEKKPCSAQESTPDTMVNGTVSDTIHSSCPTNVSDSDTHDNDSQNSADSQKCDGEILESQHNIGGSKNSNSGNIQDDSSKKIDEYNDKIDNQSKSVTKNGSNPEDPSKDSTKEVKTKKLDKEQLMAVYKTLIGFGEVNNMDKKKTENDNTKAVVVVAADRNVENVTTFYKKCKNTKRAMKNEIPDKESQYINESNRQQETVLVLGTSHENFNETDTEGPNKNRTEIIKQSSDNKVTNEQNKGDIDMTEQNTDHTEIIQQNNLDPEIAKQNINDTEISEQNIDETEVTEQNIDRTEIIKQNRGIYEQNIDHTETVEQNIDDRAIDDQNTDQELIEQSIDDTKIMEQNVVDTKINENIVIEEEIINGNVIGEQIINGNGIEEEIIDNNQIEEEIIDNNEIKELEKKKIANADDKATKNENDNIKKKCCNCNKSSGTSTSGGRPIHYSIIPDGKSAKYCLKCSSIFETETCCYCEKLLHKETLAPTSAPTPTPTPCASCNTVL